MGLCCPCNSCCLCCLYLTYVHIQLSLRVQEDDVDIRSLPDLEQGIIIRSDIVGEYLGHWLGECLNICSWNCPLCLTLVIRAGPESHTRVPWTAPLLALWPTEHLKCMNNSCRKDCEKSLVSMTLALNVDVVPGSKSMELFLILTKIPIPPFCFSPSSAHTWNLCLVLHYFKYNVLSHHWLPPFL